MATPAGEKDKDEETVVDASKLKDGEDESGGVASGADSSAWTYSPDAKPDGPR